MHSSEPALLTRAIRACLLTTLLLPATAALARDVEFDLQGGTIEEVLPEFARQAGVQIVAPGTPSRNGAKLARFKGSMDPHAMLERLLAGSGLAVIADDGRTITLGAAAPMRTSLAATPLASAQAQPSNEPVQAQTTPTAAGKETHSLGEVTVVGTQIKGSAAAAILPITTLDAKQIEATGAVSGDDLYRAIPQMGDVSFTGNNGGNSSNYARGDIASVNLRGLGPGNTLLLINGRRTVTHPTSQADDQLVPVLTYNANAVPVQNLARVEVLLDGAAAIYGTDAVAGVVNNVLRDDVDGGNISIQRGAGEGTAWRDTLLSGVIGKNFANQSGNVTLAYSYYTTTGLNSLDQGWTSTSDRRFDFVNTRFAGVNALDNRLTASEWGNFATPASAKQITSNGVPVTTAAGAFHSQPIADGGCAVGIASGVCLGTGTLQTSGKDRDTRQDAQARWPISISPDVNRLNLFLTTKYDFENGIGFFSETGYYRSEADSLQPPVNSISSLPVTIPASNYWNPFGAATLPNGSPNPNRLPGLNIPAAGLPVTMTSYRFATPTQINVVNDQYRLLAGLRGNLFGFDWESAAVYSRASVRDVQDQISLTAFQKALADSTPNAYNPFVPVNSDAASAPFRIKAVRKSTDTLAMLDFKASRPDVFSYRAGDVGVAFGLEARRETQNDRRDPRVNGTITYTDSVTGISYPSDLFGVSPTPDTRGSRSVASAFAELSLPLVSNEMNIPLVRSLDLQIAGRAEHYSDFGSVAKPKIALGWQIVEGLRFRTSWAQGFRAPNLEQINASVVTRSNIRTDYIQCEADLRRGVINSFANCNQSSSTTARRSGNPDLKPETSENFGAGFVFQPQFLPESAGRATFSVDYFKYQQKGIIGLFGEGNALILDYLDRVQGSSNPNVIRAAPTADDIARYTGTGLAPAGKVLYVLDKYVNLQPQTVRGIDFGINWKSPDTAIGRFDLALNGTRLIEFYRSPSPEIAALLAARAAGTINPGTSITGGGDLIGQGGKPKIKWTGNLVWTKGPLTAGASLRYVSSFYDTGLIDSTGHNWEIDSALYTNVFARYDFGDARSDLLSRTSIKVGINNLRDRRPPISSDTFGYNSLVYTPYPRYYYVTLSKGF